MVLPDKKQAYEKEIADAQRTVDTKSPYLAYIDKKETIWKQEAMNILEADDVYQAAVEGGEPEEVLKKFAKRALSSQEYFHLADKYGIMVVEYDELQKESFPDHFQTTLDVNPVLADWVRNNDVVWNKEKNDIEFRTHGLAIQALPDNGKEIKGDEKMHEQRLKAKGYRLPHDIDYETEDVERNALYPEKSDYDKIIATLPGADDQAKGTLFSQLMGMKGSYLTGALYNDNSEHVVRRYFNSDGWDRGCYDADNNGWYARGVRSL